MSEPGPWRVIPSSPHVRRPFWMVGRDKGGGIEFALTAYSRQIRKWYSEGAAERYRDDLVRGLQRSEQTARESQLARALATCWPFPVSAHDWQGNPP